MFKMRKTLALTILAVFAICLFVPMAAMAANPADAVATTVSKAAVTQDAAADANTGSKAYLGFAIAIGLGIAVVGGALGQGRTAAAALDGIARNPSASGKIFTPMILGLALIESLVLYSLVMGFVLLGKV
ncbi:MAG TPA: F0F1 ATP synthase subunit C [Myxococcales bacterium]|nr:F0F1 ATP synthase subunit C [Myxococcales bacterium]HIN86498.1 F0F1 ATP synthase subunit C [Myxococcales bacterium]